MGSEASLIRLTKFPSSEGCEFSKDEAAFVCQLQEMYKSIKVVVWVAITGAAAHPEA